jgi:hypothetical protein
MEVTHNKNEVVGKRCKQEQVQQTHNLTNGVKLHRKLSVTETVPNSGQWNYF